MNIIIVPIFTIQKKKHIFPHVNHLLESCLLLIRHSHLHKLRKMAQPITTSDRQGSWTFLPIPISIVIGMSVGTLLGIQLIVGVIHWCSTVIIRKLTVIHVVTKRRVWPIKRIKLTVPKNTKNAS